MKCKHLNIKVYEERVFAGRFENGIVVYDPKNEEDSFISECRCIDCDMEFSDVEVMS